MFGRFRSGGESKKAKEKPKKKAGKEPKELVRAPVSSSARRAKSAAAPLRIENSRTTKQASASPSTATRRRRKGE